MNSQPEEFGRRLKRLREMLNLPVKDFAAKIHSDKTYIYKLENGLKTRPSSHFLARICDAFNVNPEWLESEEEPVFLEPNEENLLAYANVDLALPLAHGDSLGAQATMLSRMLARHSTEHLKEIGVCLLRDGFNQQFAICDFYIELANLVTQEIQRRQRAASSQETVPDSKGRPSPEGKAAEGSKKA